MKFFHTLPILNNDDTMVHQVTVEYLNDTFLYKNGRYQRYFDTLDEFVRWHYVSQGWTIVDQKYSFGSEATSLYYETYDTLSLRPIWVRGKNYLEHMKIESRF